MKLTGKCRACGGNIEFEATPMPKDRTDGQDGFFEYDFDCPHCGHNVEGVLH